MHVCLLLIGQFVPPQDKIDRSNSQTYQYFPVLRDWISHFLGTNGDMTASQIGNNMLVQQVQ